MADLKMMAVAMAALLLGACGAEDPTVCSDDETLVGGKCVVNETSEPNNVTTTGATCLDACEKRLNVCGFREFDGDISTCVSVCDETPAAERNIACYLDATCVEISELACDVETVSAEQYDAYRGADGPVCGSDANDYNVYCEPRDACLSSRDIRCGHSASSYDAYRGAGGPVCGSDANDYNVYCEPGDNCASSADIECVAATGTYDAYRGAGGPVCGSDVNDYNVYCEPRDSCVDESSSECSN